MFLFLIVIGLPRGWEHVGQWKEADMSGDRWEDQDDSLCSYNNIIYSCIYC